eukprot:TRINITY_DN7189_c0_g1_i2.p1 TRINITY_DN7189_c0_g1~~TRINITY_DN7189_c0_g1_i2.p1  ORF type:complete len:1328 (+),score=420.68 TRINITY_DN7189_c0_g1_i2:1117-5100(+)
MPGVVRRRKPDTVNVEEDVQRKVSTRNQLINDGAMTSALALGTLSFAVHLAIDSLCRPYTDVPDLPLLIVADVLMLISSPLAHYAATYTVPGYDVWQPFKGGDTFILLQMLGWLLYSVWLLTAGIILNSKIFALTAPFSYGSGFLSLAGFIGFVATVLVVVSPSQYVLHTSWEFPYGNLVRKKKESLLSAVLTLSAFFLLVVVDALIDTPYIKNYGYLLCFYSALGFCSACILAHATIGMGVHAPHYKIWQPFQGGVRFVLAQCIGWAGFSTALYISINFDVPALPQGAPSLLGWMYALSFCTLLYSVELFEANNPVFMIWTGERLIVFMLSLVGSGLFVLIEILRYYYETPPTSYFNLALFGGALTFTLPVITQYLASRQQEQYQFFMPFIGGVRFIALQAFGWTIYTCTLIVWLLYMINPNPWKHIFAVGIFGFVTEACILLSPNFFEAETVPRDKVEFLYGELILSTVLAMGGGALFYIVDVTEETAFPRQQILAVAVAATSTAPVIAQFCGRRAHASFKAIQPFQGGAEFVALQSIGWTIFAVMLIFYSILLLNFNILIQSFATPWLTICGVIGLLPWTIIIGSIKYYQDSASVTPHSDIQVSLTFKERSEVSDEIITQLDGLVDQVGNPELKELLNSITEQCVAQRERRNHVHSITASQQSHPITTLVATGISVMAFFLCVLADILQAFLPKNASNVPIIILASGAVLFTLPPVLVHCKTGPSKFSHYRLWQPFRGGFNFVLLQTLGWFLYSLAIAVVLVVLFSQLQAAGPQIFGLYSLIALLDTGAYCVILLSLSHFEDDRDAVAHCGKDSFLQRNAEWTVSLLMTTSSSSLFIAINAIKTKWEGLFSVAPVFFLAGLALFASIPLMYIAVRKSRQNRPMEYLRDDSGTEVFGWIMYGVQAALATMLVCHTALTVLPLRLLTPLVASTTVIVFLGQAGFYLVIFWNEGRKLTTALHDALVEVAANTVAMGIYLLPVVFYVIWLILCFGFRQSHGSMYFFVYMHLVTFSHLHAPAMVLVRVACFVGVLFGGFYWYTTGDLDMLGWTTLAMVYTTTYKDDHITGARASERAMGAVWVWDLIGKYFGLTVVADEGADLKAELMKTSGPLLFGFHPHGIYPFTCVYGCLNTAWRNAVGVIPSVHAASVLFGPPMMRELVMWLGGRDVSRRSLDVQLRSGGAALLVPGGQAEMRHSSSSSPTMTLVSKHKGFIRLAIQHGASLVPIFSFGEHELMDNIYLPTIQTWFIRTLGFGYPHLPYGRMFLPIPRRRKVTLVVGRPIPVKQISHPTQAQIDAVHLQYYTALQSMFDRHKKACGSENLTLKFV